MTEEEICEMIYGVIFSVLLMGQKKNERSYSNINWKEDGRFIVIKCVLIPTPSMGSNRSLNMML